jgi:hypothetical protein
MFIKLIFKRKDGKAWNGSSRSKQGQVAGSCEHDIKTSGCVKCDEILDQIINY